jgi:hypothetical protein
MWIKSIIFDHSRQPGFFSPGQAYQLFSVPCEVHAGGTVCIGFW